MKKIKLIEYLLYASIVFMIFFILGNYKYQPALSADEIEAVEEINQLKSKQAQFVEKNQTQLGSIDLSNYKVNSGYSELLVLIQDLLDLQVISGYYNEETEKTIKTLQKKHKLEETGELDEATFLKLMNESLPLSEDDLHDHHQMVKIIQRELNLQDDGYLGTSTIEAMQELKKELDSEEQALIDDVMLTHIIENLTS